MAKLTVAKAKQQIIAQIKRKGGLFENVGQKEIQQLKSQIEGGWYSWDDNCEELQQWIDTLDCDTVKQYL
jgi:anti-sigma28 factor (negative regulator of flagellin synthesis)